MVKKPLKIKSDSKYSIHCMNPYCEQSQSFLTIDFHVGFQKWLPKWQRNGFKTATGDVKNVGIIRYLSAHIDARASYGQKIILQHVKGHNGEEGNEGADAQANMGTILPAVPERDWEKLESELRERMETGEIGSAEEPNVAMEVKDDDLTTGTAMKVRKVSAEGTPSASAARLGSAPEAAAISTGMSDSSSVPEQNTPTLTVESQITEMPFVSEFATAGASNFRSPRKSAMSSKTHDIIAALRSPPRAKPGSPSVSPRRKISPSLKVASVMKKLFPSGSTSVERQTSPSPTKVVSRPTKSRSRFPLTGSPSQTIYSRDPYPPSSPLNTQLTLDGGERRFHSPINFLAAPEEEVVTTPGDPPLLESASTAQPIYPLLPEQSTADDSPKSPQQLVVNKEDVDFMVRVLIPTGMATYVRLVRCMQTVLWTIMNSGRICIHDLQKRK
jgi:ribonuclease HI